MNKLKRFITGQPLSGPTFEQMKEMRWTWRVRADVVIELYSKNNETLFKITAGDLFERLGFIKK